MTDILAPGAVERHLRARRDTGRGLLMPYVTGGIAPGWTRYLEAFAEAGADAIEVGLPFSDPTLDGATIQQASETALARGASTRRILADLAEGRDPGVPLVASTYYNLVLHDGPEAFCAALRRAGVGGLIVPDLPVHEADELADAAAAAGIDLALLASPATPQPRLAEISRRSRGFVYAVSLMGTTGERAALAASAAELTARIRRGTDRPVLLGFGISTPDQAREARRHADGVVVGAAVMRRVLDGAGPDDLRDFLATLRQALDQE
ncbi:tryptophan synthase subunit alpha [Planomonospora venezuelensis]|uniref:Tryptophan synthase alpha chain n=1 Tax=Planomonospora venezuelensis TaxID=1999 RepID=A0A841DEX2_PLAVE|nr:tryptophan synthase subunit alpha [Planomonospora venezuelensis]MBB5966954.1 tryptophan synthase alpha chain [Planomonospora venezuelensis]GIN01578.1 tryptophan synthase alpha chain [Planomonospora venezuelensis]